MKENKTEPNKNVHEPQEPHSEADCKINEHPHNHPSVDCGHKGTEDFPVNKWASVGPGYQK